MAAVRKMPWGKHKGIPLTDVDTGYLEWALINSTTLKPRLKSWLLDELTSRDINLAAKYEATDALSLIRAGYKSLSKKHHPDVGGDPAQFRQLKTTLDALINALESGRLSC